MQKQFNKLVKTKKWSWDRSSHVQYNVTIVPRRNPNRIELDPSLLCNTVNHNGGENNSAQQAETAITEKVVKGVFGLAPCYVSKTGNRLASTSRRSAVISACTVAASLDHRSQYMDGPPAKKYTSRTKKIEQ